LRVLQRRDVLDFKKTSPAAQASYSRPCVCLRHPDEELCLRGQCASDISTIAVNPDSYNPCLPSGGTFTTHCDLRSNAPGAHSGDAAAQQGFAAQLGFRLPNIVISPFTKAHYVSHSPVDHTAVIKFVENRFIGPTANLTARDAAQSNLLEFFNFSNPPWATPPKPPVPVSASSLGYNPCTPTKMQ